MAFRCPDAVIRRQAVGTWQTFDLEGFLSPRIAPLRDGRMEQFHEWETHEQTLRLGIERCV